MSLEALFTIGYEDRSVDEFLDRLKKHKIKVLVDIREKPISRKRGFSKTPISNSLENIGIKYLHVSELGSPTPLRDKLHRDNDYPSFFEAYAKYLDTIEDVVEELYDDIVANNTTCLMCMERDPFQCHRMVVAKKVKEINGNGLKITHI